MTKSSTEAELVALSDMLKQVEIYDELIKSQGYYIENPLTILQDNQSIINLVTKGGRTLQNKHLQVRQNLVKKAADCAKIEVMYVLMQVMLTDGQTKPIQGTWRDVLTQ